MSQTYQFPKSFRNIATEYPKYIPEGPVKILAFLTSTLNDVTVLKQTHSNTNVKSKTQDLNDILNIRDFKVVAKQLVRFITEIPDFFWK